MKIRRGDSIIEYTSKVLITMGDTELYQLCVEVLRGLENDKKVLTEYHRAVKKRWFWQPKIEKPKLTIPELGYDRYMNHMSFVYMCDDFQKNYESNKLIEILDKQISNINGFVICTLGDIKECMYLYRSDLIELLGVKLSSQEVVDFITKK